MLYMNNIKSVYHGQHGLRTVKEVARSYLTITKDVVVLVSHDGCSRDRAQLFRIKPA
jgi:hypothetical protein